ncbi:MAG: glycosyltransferase, partial [Pseudoxanthomonas sp.]
LSVGAVVITTDGEPMNELIDHEHGILIPPARTGTKELAERYFVDAQGIETAVNRALSLSPQECEQVGFAARSLFLRNDRSFRMRFPAVLDSDPYRVGMAYRV